VSAPPAISLGGIYWVTDAEISLPPEANRKEHSRRQVVVVSGNPSNTNPDWPVVLIMPISSETSRNTPHCVKLAYGESNMSKKCWIRTALVQPVEKTVLQDFVGELRPERLEELLSRLFGYMGVI
jgi:mRNA-degrading endonuclease toxin of MazEF toxin-antitoxin module